MLRKYSQTSLISDRSNYSNLTFNTNKSKINIFEEYTDRSHKDLNFNSFYENGGKSDMTKFKEYRLYKCESERSFTSRSLKTNRLNKKRFDNT